MKEPCNCRELDAFKIAMRNAKRIERKTGVKYAVFGVAFGNGKTVSFGTLNEAKKNANIVCYWLTDGTLVTKDLNNKAKKEIKK